MKNLDETPLSGRWILAICAGLTFVIFSLTSCLIMWKKSAELEASEVLLFAQSFNTIIVTVFAFYFTKTRLNGNAQNNQTPPNIPDDNGSK